MPLEAISNRLRNELWNEEALFDVTDDPREERDAAAANAAVKERLARTLKDCRGLKPRYPLDAGSKTELSEEDRERLRQLGYVY